MDVSYKPSEPGLYIVNLKFADQHAPGSPFAVAVSGEGTERQTEKINTMREAVPVTEVGSQCRRKLRKRSCWSWYVFPVAPWVVSGRERGSMTNQQYVVANLGKKCALLSFILRHFDFLYLFCSS